MRYLFTTFLLFVSFAVIAQISPVLQVESYTLENGMTVYLNPDPSATRVFGAVAVNAGSKNDPSDATGIAHYLEHLLFKGTEDMGTWDYEKEKIHLDSISYWYQKLGETTDENRRLTIQQRINEQSVKASQYALPNDFDNLLKSIGATGVNAFTSPDMTFYHNSFPANQVEKWLDIFSHRFENPVFRSFQSELEVVYEEKNRAMDGFQYQIMKTGMEALFSPHPYGTQTTLGKTEHLKNPNLHKMYDFFNTYYVSNNMALILTGNFDAEEVKPMIEQTFGTWKRGADVPQTNFPIKKIQGKEKVKVRYSPIKVAVFGFKTGAINNPDKPTLDVISKMMTNSSETGFLDQLNQNNRFTYGLSINLDMNDDGASVFFIVPKILIQSFGKAKRLLFGEIQKVKEGQFSDEMLQAVKNEIEVSFQSSLEDVTRRGIAIGECFNQEKTWENHLAYTQKINAISKEEVQRVARKYFGDNYLTIESRMGFPKKKRLTKPPYRPVAPNASKQSDYAQAFYQKEGKNTTPRFLNLKEDATYIQLQHNNRLYVTPNPINDIFSLSIRYQYGNDNNRDLRLATALMDYAGTPQHSMQELKRAFAALGAEYSIKSDRNFLIVNLKGKEENLQEALQLLNALVHQPVVDKKALKLLAKEARMRKRMEKTQPSVIGNAMRFYAINPNSSYYLKRFTKKEIKNASVYKMLGKFKEGINYGADIHFTGNMPAQEVKNLLAQHYTLSTRGDRELLLFMEPARYKKPHIYFVHNKKAVQSQVYFYVAGKPFKRKDYPYYQAFNNYFGDGFSGLVLQEIREYRSLAYSAWGRYFHPLKSGKRGFLNTFVGCQGDKTNEAIEVMMDLIQNLPEKPERMPQIRKALQQKAHSDFPAFRKVSQRIAEFHRIGYKKTPQEKFYPQYSTLEMKDIMQFHKEHIQGQPVIITIYGNKNLIDFKALEKYGEVKELKLKDVIVF